MKIKKMFSVYCKGVEYKLVFIFPRIKIQWITPIVMLKNKYYNN